MRDAGASRLVDQSVIDKTVEIEGLADGVMLSGRKKVGEKDSARWDGLESTRSSSTIQEQVGERALADDGRGVRRDVNDARPLSHQLELSEARKHFEQA